MITTEEAALRLGVTRRRVQELAVSGILVGKKISGSWFIEETSVERRLSSVNKRGGRPRRGSARNETAFMLMNRGHEVARVVYNSTRKEFTGILGDIDEKYAPIGVMTRGRGMSLQAFNEWWRGRGIPSGRMGLLALLAELGVDFPEELLQRNLGLSLSDQYWICPDGSGLTWENINFFNNDFGEVSLATESFAADGKSAVATPDNTSDGNLRKRWVCRGGVRMLLKGGTSYGQEPYNEVVATSLHGRLLGAGEFVPYAVEGEGANALSCCAEFLADDEEFVPAVYVERALNQDANRNDFEHYLDCCDCLGVHGARAALERMIVCDDVIANHDRHRRNFGIVRNVETLECRPAPIFDSGSSLWCDVDTSRLEAGEHSFVSRQFYENPAHQMLLVGDMSWLKADALDGFVDEAMGILSANDALAARLPYIREALGWRVRRMIDIAEWA